MNIKQVLEKTEDFLAGHNIPRPRLDAEVLLADLLDMERIKLYVNFDYPLTGEELSNYRERVTRRARRYPVAYLTGHKEFMSLEFTVNEKVMIPRPETELLVEEIINYCNDKNLTEPNIVDVGTGSGAIMVSLGYYLPEARVVGVEVEEGALSVARENIKKYNLADRVKALRGDLLQPFLKHNKRNVDIIISNPPYIKEKELADLPPEVKREPRTALAGGEDGLDIYRRLIPQSRKVLAAGGVLALEIGCEQGAEVTELFSRHWQKIEVKKDYADHDRIVRAIKSEL